MDFMVFLFLLGEPSSWFFGGWFFGLSSCQSQTIIE
jgi:hypothetical protein